MNKFAPIIAAVLAFSAGHAPAATVLSCTFDSLREWSLRTVGAANAEIVERETAGGDDRTNCVEITSHRGTALLTRQLPLEQIKGGSVTVRCLVKSERILRGPQASSTGKLHLAVLTPRGISHHYVRFVGTADWREEGFTVDLPDDVQRVLLNLGLESCAGRVQFDRLIVQNDRRGIHRLNLRSTVNAGHDQLRLAAFPKQTVEWNGIPFEIIDAAGNNNLDCFRLKGHNHPDWPAATSAPITVSRPASTIYILHGVLGGSHVGGSACAIWNAKFVDGQTAGKSVFEGQEIGTIGATEDLENWSVAWRGPNDSARPVTFGVTRWPIYNGIPIESISCRAYQGAAPVVLAVTVVEEPPQPETEDVDDGSGFQ